MRASSNLNLKLDRPRYDSAMFWLAFGTAAAVIGLALMTIGVSRLPANANVFSTGWFDGGLALLAVGALLLLWALWLFLSRRRTATDPSLEPGPAEAKPAPHADAEAEAVKGYFREREKIMDTAMDVWKQQQQQKNRSRKDRA